MNANAKPGQWLVVLGAGGGLGHFAGRIPFLLNIPLDGSTHLRPPWAPGWILFDVMISPEQRCSH